MKAWILHHANDLRYEDMEVPDPAPGEVRIRVKAAGICGSDIPRIYETGAHKMPLVPGHEFSGIVEELGKEAPSYWLGKRVGVYPLIPCGKCRPCTLGHPEMCRDYDYVGSRRNGAFAEYVTVPASNLIELPESIGFEEAAMLEPMSVAVHAIRRVPNAKKDEEIVVCGLGTIGLFVLMFLLDAGYRKLWTIGNKDFQKKKVIELGLDQERYIDIREYSGKSAAGKIASQMNGTGADIYFECVGKQETFQNGLELTNPSGRLVAVGNPASDMLCEKDSYWKILRNQLTVYGTWNSTFTHGPDDDWHEVLQRLQSGQKPEVISHRLSMQDLERGLRIMKEKTEDYGKIMMCS